MGIIRFPRERCQYSLENYRPQGATILIMPLVRIERSPADACLDAFTAMSTAFLELHEALWLPPRG
jgi:uroporphyrinogen-III synthase